MYIKVKKKKKNKKKKITTTNKTKNKKWIHISSFKLNSQFLTILSIIKTGIIKCLARERRRRRNVNS